EEIWAAMGQQGLVSQAAWPRPEESLLQDDSITLPIQINGKRRAEISVPTAADKAAVEALALQDAAVQRALDGATPRKVIVVPGRIVNVVV
ncbi:MAG: leucine--tRNA ligase, partial [Pseudomonadota bacterium]